MDEEKETLDTGEPAEESEESSASEVAEEEKTVPYKRFKEVYGENKQLKQDLQRITELEKKEDKGTLTEKESQELEAKKYLKGLVLETLADTEKEREKMEQQELAQFQADVDDFLSLNTDVKRADFLKFLESEADDYGVKSVEGAGKLFLKLNKTSAEASEKAKEDFKKKPGLPSHEGGGQSKGYDSAKDQGKSLTQLAYEKINEFGLK